MHQDKFTLDFLMKSTPLIRRDFEYKRELTEAERVNLSVEIADATVEIERRSAQIKELQEEAKSYAQERKTKADIIDSQMITDFAPEAVMFYDPASGFLDIHVEKDGVMTCVMSRQAYSGEISEWNQKQQEIRQTEIENGVYRQQLTDLSNRAF